ncbi:surface-adhesin E family protein [Brevundimonas sp.]|uniref:surface-adhesin E family protein n=1 Tax=Brevundimonas sp. TaxID=1871086 RepID=UPI002ED911BC
MTPLLIAVLLSLSGQQTPPPVIIEYDGRTPPPPGVAVPEARPSRPALLPLPTGELKAFAENNRAVHFVDVESAQRDGDRVRVRYYTVFHPPAPSGDRLIAHWITEADIDCAARTLRSLRLSAYDEAGDEVLWLPPEPVERIAPGSLQAELHQAVCLSHVAAPHPRLTGWREALPFGRARLGG